MMCVKPYSRGAISTLTRLTRGVCQTTRKIMEQRGRLLTGDTPTGRLHLGHWVGSIQNRIKMQEEYDSYFILANYHAFTTCYKDPHSIRKSTLDIATDYFAAGIDPEKATIFVQSDISAIHELMFIFSMLITHQQIMHNPTLKSELKEKSNGTQHPFGFILYPLGQVADILAFRPDAVPVGEDQLPHIEMTRRIAGRFNELYCRDQPHLFPLPQAILGKEKRLVGINPPTADGTFQKMSKSLGNAIFLSDSRDVITRKVKKIYTDPNRLTPTTPGVIENNPLWMFLDALHPNPQWLSAAKDDYQKGKISDRACKEELALRIWELVEPMQERRARLEANPNFIIDVLREGSKKAAIIANNTLLRVKELIFQKY